MPSNLFHSGGDRPLPHNGRSREFLNGMETVLQEGDKFPMDPLVAGGSGKLVLLSAKIIFWRLQG